MEYLVYVGGIVWKFEVEGFLLLYCDWFDCAETLEAEELRLNPLDCIEVIRLSSWLRLAPVSGVSNDLMFESFILLGVYAANVIVLELLSLTLSC